MEILLKIHLEKPSPKSTRIREEIPLKFPSGDHTKKSKTVLVNCGRTGSFTQVVFKHPLSHLMKLSWGVFSVEKIDFSLKRIKVRI